MLRGPGRSTTIGLGLVAFGRPGAVDLGHRLPRRSTAPSRGETIIIHRRGNDGPAIVSLGGPTYQPDAPVKVFRPIALAGASGW